MSRPGQKLVAKDGGCAYVEVVLHNVVDPYMPMTSALVDVKVIP